MVVIVGGYYGIHNLYVVSTNRNRGVPKVLSNYVVTNFLNNLEKNQQTIEFRRAEIASLIMEPVINIDPIPGFIQPFACSRKHRTSFLSFTR